MNRVTPDGSRMVELLAASGPFEAYADQLMLFGQFVGSWDVEASYFDESGALTRTRRGEWHFGWVLEGRAIQDVLLTPPLAERGSPGARSDEYGTTVRFYDPKTDSWQVTWLGPVFGLSVSLIARRVGEEIWLEGRSPDGNLCRWTFSEIRPDSFRWRGFDSSDEGRSWFLSEEMQVRRRAAV